MVGGRWEFPPTGFSLPCHSVCKQATGVQCSITRCLCQARMHCVSCSRKSIRQKTEGRDEGRGTGDPSELTSSCVSVNASVGRTSLKRDPEIFAAVLVYLTRCQSGSDEARSWYRVFSCISCRLQLGVWCQLFYWL